MGVACVFSTKKWDEDFFLSEEIFSWARKKNMNLRETIPAKVKEYTFAFCSRLIMTLYKSPNLDVQSLIISTRKTKKGLMKTNVYKDNEKSFSPLTAPLHD